MSKATKRHCAGTVQSQGGRVRNVKQVSFEPGPERKAEMRSYKELYTRLTFNLLVKLMVEVSIMHRCCLASGQSRRLMAMTAASH